MLQLSVNSISLNWKFSLGSTLFLDVFSVEDAGNIERTDTEMAVVSSQPESSIGREPKAPMQEITTKDVDSVEPMDLQEGCSFENDRENGGEVVVDEEKMEDGSQDSSISVAGNLTLILLSGS